MNPARHIAAALACLAFAATAPGAVRGADNTPGAGDSFANMEAAYERILPYWESAAFDECDAARPHLARALEYLKEGRRFVREGARHARDARQKLERSRLYSGAAAHVQVVEAERDRIEARSYLEGADNAADNATRAFAAFERVFVAECNAGEHTAPGEAE